MCGIAGAYRLSGTSLPVETGLEAAVACLAHRGPDDSGLHVAGNVALGHRRLSILDTSSAGHQPFTEGPFTIIYNGEAFNYPHLRQQLEEQGHTFRSTTDTEVVLRLFQQKGQDFLHDLNGFFALAIHNAEDDSLLIARDRFGVKPLLWAEQDGRLLFASELRALEHMGVRGEVDRVSLRTYLTHHYIPAPHSIRHGVHKLLPGHLIRAGRKGIAVERWFDPVAAANTARNIADPVQHVRQLLDDAVRMRLLSDVPVGTFLSGGLDSSIVSALASRHTDRLKTFSIGFTDRYFDETPHAEAVARHIGSEHHSFILGAEELAAAYTELLGIIDEPFADSSALPAYLLNRYTRQHVVVALSGDGADEIFGGYRKHQAELRTREPGALERIVRLGAPLWGLLPRSRNGALTDRIRQLDRFARAARMPAEERYLWLAAFEEDRIVDALLGPERDPEEWQQRRTDMTAPLRADGSLNGLLMADLHTVLPNDMLHKVDLTSMANGLEVRTPFLDHRLVSYAFSLPASVKFSRGNGKKILREAFGNILPPSIVGRAKQGFEVPLRALFLGPLAGLLDAELEPGRVRRAGFDPAAVRALRERLAGNSPGNAQATVHALLVYLTWWRRNNTE
jgi:asparagine synthase (glutamine-hydrolysing)